MFSGVIDVIASESDIKHKLTYLNALINVNGVYFENEEEINLVKAKIKEFCADATQRTEGLLLLWSVVHCSSAVYVDNWSQIVLGSIQIPDSLISREIPLKVVNRMLVNFGSDSDYNDVFSKIIPEILPTLLNPDDLEIYKLSCHTLAICMKCVPKIVATRVVDIEKFLLKELDNPYGDIMEAVGECFATLPICLLSLSKAGSIGYKDIWNNIFMKILNTMHFALNSVLQLTPDQEEYVDLHQSAVFDIPALELDDANPLTQISIYKSLCQCMAKMMSSDNCMVRVPVAELLDSFLRIFQIEKMITPRNQNPRVEILKVGFPLLLNGAYVVLEALILNFNIIDQSHNFLVLMNTSLSAMEVTSCSQSSVSQVRGSTWKLINVWLKQYGSKGSYYLAKDKTILQQILADVDIEENGSVQSNQLRNNCVEEKNQKANKIFACTHALKVLKNLLDTSDGYLEDNSKENICSTLLRVSKVLVRNISLKSFPTPYSDEKCRKLLFDALSSCALCGHKTHSKCIMEAQNIFNALSKDPSLKVHQVCRKFRLHSRSYLHPKKPPPDATQYSHEAMLNRNQNLVLDNIKTEWGHRNEWSRTNGGPSSDDQMDDSDVAQVHGESAYSDRMGSEGDLTIEQEENESDANHCYRVKQSSQSAGDEESLEDSDIEPTYVSADSNPQRIGVNDSSHVNSFGMQSNAEQFANQTRTERHMSEEIVASISNSVENNIAEHVSAFVEIKSAAQKSTPPMGNGEWKKGENNESDEDESDMDEEGDEEGEANEEMSDNAADEASDGKHSPEFDEERPSKRQKCVDEEGEEEVDEEAEEDEELAVNQPSSDEEENEVNNMPAVEQNAGSNPENPMDEESQENENNGCRSPTIREMCGDFVLAEPASAQEIS